MLKFGLGALPQYELELSSSTGTIFCKKKKKKKKKVYFVLHV